MPQQQNYGWVTPIMEFLKSVFEKYPLPLAILTVVVLVFLFILVFVCVIGGPIILNRLATKKYETMIEDLKKENGTLKNLVDLEIAKSSHVFKYFEAMGTKIEVFMDRTHKIITNVSISEFKLLLNIFMGADVNFSNFLTERSLCYVEKGDITKEEMVIFERQVKDEFKRLVIDRLNKFILYDSVFTEKIFKEDKINDILTTIRGFVYSLPEMSEQIKDILLLKSRIKREIFTLKESVSKDVFRVFQHEIYECVKTNENARIVMDRDDL